MKIIIVGAGVSGLSAYLQLRKVLPDFDAHTVLIYESHRPQATTSHGLSSAVGSVTDTAAVVGNSIALVPNTIRLLKYIDIGLYEIFKSRGYANKAYTFKTARGHVISVASTADQGSPPEYTVSCPRYGLWECFHEVVGESNIRYRKVVEVDLERKRPIVRFADGEEEDADLVIGADGVRSVVKRAIFGEEDEKQFGPRYEGFCGVGAFLNLDIPESISKHKSMVFTFGPTGSFGYCSAAPEAQRKIGWWSNWGTTDIPDGNTMNPEEIRRQLLDRHGTWDDPVIRTIIENMTTDRIYPIWTTPDLPHWGERGAVLLGDAAHTLPATSGQGAGQAMEDSVTFSLLLAHYISKTGTEDRNMTEADAIQMASKALYEIRHDKVATIKARSRNLYLTNKRINNILFEYLYYCFIYVWTNFPIIGQFIVGTVYKDPEELNVEENIKEYLEIERY
ncbi:putative FAD/NAD(P)-binding domain-containing protein [Seiridium cardinale]|uniref:FAD/NAD(P)-binding domain-containing protein n=1 Tax=Seiridium cardinale TaxID=138064 RepID=A0ABR2XMV2_9PEZI